MEEARILSPIVWKDMEAEKVLIGKILASKSYTRATLLSILRKAWNLHTGLDIIEITGKAFMFKFEDEEEYSQILRGRLWSINAEDLHYNGRYFRNFLRVRVMLDLRKPLVSRFWLLKPDGMNVWISVQYEKLQNFCYNCRKIGHDRRDCNMEKVMEGSNPDEIQFGAWLATPVSRSWEESLVMVPCEGAEAEYIRRK
ncbi:hypothetical protein K1719_021751 [Acacia pycnantha]|nr:hypothetical protein K1719_021751 [Acacia pycnantha]